MEIITGTKIAIKGEMEVSGKGVESVKGNESKKGACNEVEIRRTPKIKP
jgi:hypothetical protein